MLFLDALAGRRADADANNDGYLLGTELGLFLYQEITNMSDATQSPRYGKLNAYGYKRGDFVFKLKTRKSTAAELTTKPSEQDSMTAMVKRIEALEARLKARREVHGMSSSETRGDGLALIKLTTSAISKTKPKPKPKPKPKVESELEEKREISSWRLGRKWLHRESILTLDGKGDGRRFVYVKPNNAAAAKGAKKGTLRFNGRVTDNNFIGSAYYNGGKCGQQLYPVRGRVSRDGQRVLLKGKAPGLNSKCSVVGHKRVSLIFNLLSDSASILQNKEVARFV